MTRRLTDAAQGRWENKGRTARYNGAPLHDCPTRKHAERHAWRVGWFAADEERTTTSPVG